MIPGSFVSSDGHSTYLVVAFKPLSDTAAQDAANRLIGAGVNAILNFAPVVLRVPSNVVVSNVNLAIELENLSYFIQD